MNSGVTALVRPARYVAVFTGGLLGLAALTGCAHHRSAPPPPAPVPAARAAEVMHPAPGQTLLSPATPDPPTRNTPQIDPEFPAAAQILAGFDPGQTQTSWQTGDRILYGVRLEKGPQAHTWYMLVRVVRSGLEPGMRLTLDSSELEQTTAAREALPMHVADEKRTLTAPPLRGRAVKWARDHDLHLSPTSVLVYIDVYDENARPIAGVHQFIFDDYLQGGLYRSAETVRSHFLDEQPPTAGEIRQVSLSFVSLFSLGELLWGTPHVGRIFDEIVRLPSWISILLNLGVRPAFTMHYEQAIHEARELPALADGRPAWRVPFEITLNREPALRCYVIAAPNEPPLQLCGGIIGLEGADVRDPQHRFTVRLLAARAGRGPDARPEPSVARTYKAH
jgi:hypothetical protein